MMGDENDGGYDADNYELEYDVMSGEDECEVEDEAGDAGFQTEAGPLIKKQRFVVLDPDGLARFIADAVTQVADLTCVSRSKARLLLTAYRWNVENLMQNLIEKGEQALLLSAGIVESPVKPSRKRPVTDTFWCPCCFEDYPDDQVDSAECGHRFCRNCFSSHCIIKINDGECTMIPCMDKMCKAMLDIDQVRSFISDSENVRHKYEKFLLNSFIADSTLVKWCPSMPHCGYAAKLLSDEICEITCVCEHNWCFQCQRTSHSPASCEMMKTWIFDDTNDTSCATWIISHTKKCPSCQKPIEKNTGCNHVTCKCGQCFCWLCGQSTGQAHSFASIDGHSCGRYRTEIEEIQNKAAEDLKRYSHYRNFYDGHASSYAKELNTMKMTQNQLENLDVLFRSAPDFKWLYDAQKTVLKSRLALEHSYIFAFYVFGKLLASTMNKQDCVVQQQLFEDYQQQLEPLLERLSGYIFCEFVLVTSKVIQSGNGNIEDCHNLRLKAEGLLSILVTARRKMWEFSNDLLSTYCVGHEIFWL